MPLNFQAIIEARTHDPFALLGKHVMDARTCRFHTFQPQAHRVSIQTTQGDWVELKTLPKFPGLFGGEFSHQDLPERPKLLIAMPSASSYEIVDPYSFGPVLGEVDLHLIAEGNHFKLWQALGSHAVVIDNVAGVRFGVWAPNAARVSVVGDFNNWDGRRHPMRSRIGSGIWELFIPGLTVGDLYKYELCNKDNFALAVHTDPVGQSFELRPNTATRVPSNQPFHWTDHEWIARRQHQDWLRVPTNIYEVHLGSWRSSKASFPTYTALADELIPYAVEQGFTHIELLPITEHPFDGSWGYQTTGYFAPTSRFGTPEQFKQFIDRAHQAGLGVLLDWVPAHFPRDEFALAKFDGTSLYEHEDPRRGEHRDWGTLIFNYGRKEVRNFLIASALYWLEEMHLDGLRVDAVASMLYLDYSRNQGDWLPNAYGGRENLEAIDFLRALNSITQTIVPGTIIIAEESTSWPQVSRPPEQGGLGFNMKWNMGWMNDTLRYFQEDPINRQYHHNNLTFGLLYSFTENFVLPFSHDEVVHGKGSLLNKMPGDEWQKFANLRLLLAYQYTYPGKKLLFMGCEFGQGNEWNDEKALDWWMLEYPNHQGIHNLSKALNHLYKNEKTLHENDFHHSGFEWCDCTDRQNSVISYYRHSATETVLVILNFTPVLREQYQIQTKRFGKFDVMLNTDSSYFMGKNTDLNIKLHQKDENHNSLELNIPPLGAVILKILN